MADVIKKKHIRKATLGLWDGQGVTDSDYASSGAGYYDLLVLDAFTGADITLTRNKEEVSLVGKDWVTRDDGQFDFSGTLNFRMVEGLLPLVFDDFVDKSVRRYQLVLNIGRSPTMNREIKATIGFGESPVTIDDGTSGNVSIALPFAVEGDGDGVTITSNVA